MWSETLCLRLGGALARNSLTFRAVAASATSTENTYSLFGYDVGGTTVATSSTVTTVVSPAAASITAGAATLLPASVIKMVNGGTVSLSVTY